MKGGKNMASKKELGLRIKELREAKQLTQQELADILYVSDKTISKWEKGISDPGLEIIVQIADFFNVTTDFLYRGEEKSKTPETISVIELACKEDDISRLNGVDISFIDDAGRDINYFAKKYNAERIKSYLLDIKIDEYCKKNKETLFTRYICALPKNYTDDENLKVICSNVNHDDITKICSEYAEKGYHGFRVFRTLDIEEKPEKTYKWFSFRFLDEDALDDAMFYLNILYDKKSAVLEVKEVNELLKNNKRYLAYIPEKAVDDFFNTLDEIDFRNWEITHWGINMCGFYFELKDEEGQLDCPKFYVAPGPDKYKKFVNALRRLIVYLNDEMRNRLTKYLDKEYIPYYRQGINIRMTKKIFKSIEEEQDMFRKSVRDLEEKA